MSEKPHAPPIRRLTTPPVKPDGVTVTSVSAGYSIKVNVGNYESVETHEWVSADVEAHADPAAAQAYVNDLAKYGARAAILPVLARRGAKIESMWSNLPADVKKDIEGQY